jgi:HAE1 family hydrophobic/amphiphilic exporter-1
LSLEDIRGVIANTTVSAATGTIDGAARAFNVYTNDQLLKAEPWSNVVLACTSGAPIRVRDIGLAVDGPENAKIAAWAYAGPQPRRGKHCQWPHHLARHHQDAGDQCNRHGRPNSRCVAQAAGRHSPSITVNTLIDRTQTIRASVKDVDSPCCCRSLWWWR